MDIAAAGDGRTPSARFLVVTVPRAASWTAAALRRFSRLAPGRAEAKVVQDDCILDGAGAVLKCSAHSYCAMNISLPGNLGVLVFYLYWLALIVVHAGFAIAVFRDAEALEQGTSRKVCLVPGGIWALATLLGGVITAGIYWVLHHSTLRPAAEPATPPVSPPPPAGE